MFFMCTIFGALLFVYNLDMLISWSCVIDCGIKIKFSSFKKFYAINPDRWKIKDDYVTYYNIYSNVEEFHFGYIDYCRYKWWLKGYKKRKSIEKENEIMKRMIETVKQDIEKTEREAKQYQDKAMVYIRRL